MPQSERPTGPRTDADPVSEEATPGEWAERLQQQWDAVLASLGHDRSAEELRATMQLFLESQRLIMASLGSYFAALSGRPPADRATEERLSELERRVASVEQALEAAQRPAEAPAGSTHARDGADTGDAKTARSGAA